MSKSVVITTRIDEERLAMLDRLATHYDRSRAWLVARAVERYIREESEMFAAIEEGEQAIARGDYVTHEQLVAEIDAMLEGKKAA